MKYFLDGHSYAPPETIFTIPLKYLLSTVESGTKSPHIYSAILSVNMLWAAKTKAVCILWKYVTLTINHYITTRVRKSTEGLRVKICIGYLTFVHGQTNIRRSEYSSKPYTAPRFRGFATVKKYRHCRPWIDRCWMTLVLIVLVNFSTRDYRNIQDVTSRCEAIIFPQPCYKKEIIYSVFEVAMIIVLALEF